ncbi:MAG: hypothetical protein WC533_01645 [Candidatus Pacearchaeota archaeon]
MTGFGLPIICTPGDRLAKGLYKHLIGQYDSQDLLQVDGRYEPIVSWSPDGNTITTLRGQGLLIRKYESVVREIYTGRVIEVYPEPRNRRKNNRRIISQAKRTVKSVRKKLPISEGECRSVEYLD